MIPSVRLIELCLIGSAVLDESEWIRNVRADSRSVHHLCPLCLLFFLSSSFFLLLSLSSCVSLSASITFSLSLSSLMSQGDLCWPFASWLLLIWTFSTGEVSDRLSASFSLTVRRLTACDNVNEDETHYSVSSSFCQQTQPSEPQYSVGLSLITSTPICSYYNRNIKYDLFKLLTCIIMYINICVCCLRCDWWWEESRATRRRREKKRNRKCLPVQTAQDRLLLKVLLLKVCTQIQWEKVTEYIYLIVLYFCSTECQREMFYFSFNLSFNFHFKIWCEVFEVN